MWNYSFIAPNLILLVVFLIFYFSQPHLPISKNRSFLRMLIIEIFVTLSDITASKFLDNYHSYPKWIHLALNTLYFLSFILRSLFFFQFTESLFTPKSQRKIRDVALSYIVFSISFCIVLANLITPTLFYLDDSGYHRGEWYNVLYVNGFFYLSLSFVRLIFFKKRLDKREFLSSLTANILLLLGFTLRILLPQYLIMNYFCMLSIIVSYLAFENSALYLENRTSAFNMESLLSLLGEKVGQTDTLVLGILLNNYNDMREIYSGTQIDKGISLIADNFRRTYPDLSLFYLNSGRFVLVGSGYSSESLKQQIKARFTKPWKSDNSDMELYLDVQFVEVSQDFSINNENELLHALLSAFNSIGVVSDSDMTISNDTLKILAKNRDIKRAVRHSVENKSVEMFLQPLVDINTHRLVGAEALARLRDDNGSLLPPNVFIPIAEKNGHINSLGEQIFEKACEFIRDNDLEEMGISWINVNLSPLQFLRSDLTSRFSAILDKYDVNPEKIHLEITEEAMIDYALLQKQIQSMKRMGFEFVLDDFGSGYSNVTRLKRYPFINIKLDMEIVWDYFKNHDQILPALVQAFKHMGFTVTAEGIETKEMAAEMKWLGCDYLQGFYFSRPIPANEFVQKYGKNISA